MTNRDVKNILENAIKNLYKNQPNISMFTPESGETEWNLVHHLIFEIHKFLPEYDCDGDVLKRSLGNLRPDIIFHKRGDQDNNFLVIEVKFDGTVEEIEKDINKIKYIWFMDPLRYKFGATINLKRDKTYKVDVHLNTKYHKK